MILRDRARRGVSRDLKLGAKDIRSLLESTSIVALAKATVFLDIKGVIPRPAGQQPMKLPSHSQTLFRSLVIPRPAN